jgi:nicotinate-nucleotide adenylyltransferase
MTGPVSPLRNSDNTGEDIKRIGIMGGSFDPIHSGHLNVAETALLRFHLAEIVFVPAYCPPHKSLEDMAPPEHRYAMVDRAIREYSFFKSSRIEMERSCPSYAGDTISAFRELYSENWQIYFITGLDALLTIINWDRARTYPGICHFIAAVRPGYNRDEIMSGIPKTFKPYISILEEPSLSISSTEIRARIGSNRSINGMVPKAVEEYIFEFSLYRRRGSDDEGIRNLRESPQRRQ